MRNENLFIQLQLQNQALLQENKRLQFENTILDTALLNTCQTICRSLYYREEEIIKLKQKYIDRVLDVYKEEI